MQYNSKHSLSRFTTPNIAGWRAFFGRGRKATRSWLEHGHLNITLVREDLAAIEEQIQFNPNDNNLINRYLTYARKVREFEYRENGYVTAPRLLRQTLEDC